MRYDTAGDWEAFVGCLRVLVSRVGDVKMEFILAVHELVEAFICNQQGISQANVDAWDMFYESQRKPGDDSEPGEHKRCPYRKAHLAALRVEMALAVELGVDWTKYEKKLNSLFK